MRPQICIEESKDGQMISYRIYCSFNSLNRLTAERTVAAAVVEYTHAPPATVRRHLLQDQMPTQVRFMAS